MVAWIDVVDPELASIDSLVARVLASVRTDCLEVEISTLLFLQVIYTEHADVVLAAQGLEHDVEVAQADWAVVL